MPDFVDSKFQHMSSTKTLRISSAEVTSPISSTVTQNGMSAHDSIMLMAMCMPSIFCLYLFLVVSGRPICNK